MSIATAITNAQNKVAAAFSKCNDKGATMPATQDLSNLPTCIDSIPTGSTPNLQALNVTPSTSSQQIVPSSPVDGYDEVNVSAVDSSIDGNIVASNIKKDVVILGVTGTYEAGGGAEFDDWLKDGDTHLWVRLVNSYQLAQDIRIRMIGTIDWGDGTTESVSVTTYTTFSHTYAATGKYRIDLKPTSGTFYLGSAAASYNIMGVRTGYYRTGALYQAEIGSNIIDTVSAHAFCYCRGLRRVYISSAVTSLGDSAFMECSSLSALELETPANITGQYAKNLFYGCMNLQSDGGYAPAGATTLNGTYYNAQCITDITIPSTVTAIQNNSIRLCSGLKFLRCLPTTPPTLQSAYAINGILSDCVIQVPSGSLADYQAATYWSDYASQMVGV